MSIKGVQYLRVGYRYYFAPLPADSMKHIHVIYQICVIIITNEVLKHQKSKSLSPARFKRLFVLVQSGFLGEVALGFRLKRYSDRVPYDTPFVTTPHQRLNRQLSCQRDAVKLE